MDPGWTGIIVAIVLQTVTWVVVGLIAWKNLSVKMAVMCKTVQGQGKAHDECKTETRDKLRRHSTELQGHRDAIIKLGGEVD